MTPCIEESLFITYLSSAASLTSNVTEVTAVPEGTVKTRIFHAKKLLQHCLGQFGIVEGQR